MTTEPPGAPRIWGRQLPFERNVLQRLQALLGLSAVFVTALIVDVSQHPGTAIGLALIGLGGILGSAAWSRARYDEEIRLGFDVLVGRDARFVVVSCAGVLLSCVMVVLLVIG